MKTLNLEIFVNLQLFDTDNHLNRASVKYLFSTEGHIFPIDYKFRMKDSIFEAASDRDGESAEEKTPDIPIVTVSASNYSSDVSVLCIVYTVYIIISIYNILYRNQLLQ